MRCPPAFRFLAFAFLFLCLSQLTSGNPNFLFLNQDDSTDSGECAETCCWFSGCCSPSVAPSMDIVAPIFDSMSASCSYATYDFMCMACSPDLTSFTTNKADEIEIRLCKDFCDDYYDSCAGEFESGSDSSVTDGTSFCEMLGSSNMGVTVTVKVTNNNCYSGVSFETVKESECLPDFTQTTGSDEEPSKAGSSQKSNGDEESSGDGKTNDDKKSDDKKSDNNKSDDNTKKTDDNDNEDTSSTAFWETPVKFWLLGASLIATFVVAGTLGFVLGRCRTRTQSVGQSFENLQEELDQGDALELDEL